MFIRNTITVLALAILLGANCPAIGQEDKPLVSILLSKASAERTEHHILFCCDAILDSAAREDLTVRSGFSSAFDGLELVVTTPDGKLLAQQGYTHHQSPFSTGRTFPLKPGRTEKTLVFPIHDLPAEVKSLKVRLVGTLPGSEYRRILSSETLEIKVK